MYIISIIIYYYYFTETARKSRILSHLERYISYITLNINTWGHHGKTTGAPIVVLTVFLV
jgi:hypothetical protein